MNTVLKTEYLHSGLTERIIKCFYTVYNELGYGFLEFVYENALLIELRNIGLEAESQVSITVQYQDQIVGDFRADIMVNQSVLLELKAVEFFNPKFEAQLLNYLKATDVEVGLLLNFGPKPGIKRFLFDNQRKLLRN